MQTIWLPYIKCGQFRVLFIRWVPAGLQPLFLRMKVNGQGPDKNKQQKFSHSKVKLKINAACGKII